MRNFVPISGVVVLLLLLGCQPDQQQDPAPEAQVTPLPAYQSGDKVIVYQMLTRLFSNTQTTNTPYGTLEENGVGKFEDITDAALTSLRDMGVTHVWYTGVLEHATMTAFPQDSIPADDADVVKGRAGSPYAIKDYYDVAPALARNVSQRMAEFESLIQRTHDRGMRVVMDFVPNHVARSYHSDQKPPGVTDLGQGDDPEQAFAVNNNFYYLPGTRFQVPADHDPLGPEEIAPAEDDSYEETPAKATGNNIFRPDPHVNDWFETAKLNYGVDFSQGEENHFDPAPATWVQMSDILLFWAGKGVDGFRCDIAEMVPVPFWTYAIARVKARHPDVIFIAEIYNPALYRSFVEEGGFDYLYDKVGLYDCLRRLMSGQGSTAEIAAALQQSMGLEKHMLRFLENHDEQRIASEEFAGDAWTGVPGMTVSALLHQGPAMIYFGQEVGEPGRGREGFQGDDGRTTIFDYWGVPEHQKWVNGGKYDGGGLSEDQQQLREFYRQLLRLAHHSEALKAGETIILPVVHEKVYAFVRFAALQRLLVVVNFDREESVEAHLQFPLGTFEAMGLHPEGVYPMSDMLLTDRQESLDGIKVSTEPGQSIVLPPNSAFVFQIDAN